MKKIILLIPFILLLACKNEVKKSDPKLSTTFAGKDSLQLNLSDINLEPQIDSLMKQKVLKAYDWLLQYARESKSMPPGFSERVIYCWSGIKFGILQKVDKTSGAASIQVENGALPTDLVVSFENTPMSISDHSGMTIYLKGNMVVLSLVSEFVKTQSVALIASVLLHELVHVQIDKDFGVSNVNLDENECSAYTAQIYFLIYAYNGPEIETKVLVSKSTDISVPNEDKTAFTIWLNMMYDLCGR